MSNIEETPNTRGPAAPSIRAEAFSCPHCGAFTHQYWYCLFVQKKDKGALPTVPDQDDLHRIEKAPHPDKELYDQVLRQIKQHLTGRVFFIGAATCYSETQAANLHLSKCYTCGEIAVWVHDRLLFPPERTGPPPNEDLSDEISADYEEARSILDLSPRGAAALLRLCIEKICVELNAKGKSLDDRIGDLVKKGLDTRVQQSLDAVRVIGNEAVHPGQIDLKDDRGTAETLFRLVNLIAEKMISEPKHVQAVYDSLPETKRNRIEQRDQKALGNTGTVDPD